MHLQSRSPVPLCLLCSYVPFSPALEGCWKARSPTDEMSPYESSSEGPPRGTSRPLLLMVVALFKTASQRRLGTGAPLHNVAKHGAQCEGTTTDSHGNSSKAASSEWSLFCLITWNRQTTQRRSDACRKLGACVLVLASEFLSESWKLLERQIQ